MPWTNRSAARAAPPDVDIEPPYEGLAGDFDLELPIDVIFPHRPAAVGARWRQRHIVDLVRQLLRQGAMRLGTIVRPGLAAGRFRVCLGRSFRERRGLPLGGAGGFVEQLLQLDDAGLQLRHTDFQLPDPAIFPGDDFQQLFVRGLGHP